MSSLGVASADLGAQDEMHLNNGPASTLNSGPEVDVSA